MEELVGDVLAVFVSVGVVEPDVEPAREAVADAVIVLLEVRDASAERVAVRNTLAERAAEAVRAPDGDAAGDTDGVLEVLLLDVAETLAVREGDAESETTIVVVGVARALVEIEGEPVDVLVSDDVAERVCASPHHVHRSKTRSSRVDLDTNPILTKYSRLVRRAGTNLRNSAIPCRAFLSLLTPAPPVVQSQQAESRKTSNCS